MRGITLSIGLCVTASLLSSCSSFTNSSQQSQSMYRPDALLAAERHQTMAQRLPGNTLRLAGQKSLSSIQECMLGELMEQMGN